MVISVAEKGRDVFFILRGRAHAILYSSDGKTVDFREIRQGDMFGELAAIDGEPRSASIVALEDSRVGRLSHLALAELVEMREQLAWALMVHLSSQIRYLTERVFEYSTLLVRERLIRELLRLAGGETALRSAARIYPAPTHFDLAARISTHREAVSREMSTLARRGLLRKQDGALHLLDVGTLRSLCTREE